MTNVEILFIPIFIILFLVFFRLYFTNDENWSYDIIGRIWNILAGVFVSSLFSLVVSGFIIAVILGIGRSGLEMEEKVSNSYHLIALDANEDIHGRYNNIFFVGSGYIGEDLYYHFFYNTKNGIKYKKILAERCYIIETDDKPSYKEFGMYYKDKSNFFYTPDEQNSTRTVLYIPKGTIKTNYKVN